MNKQLITEILSKNDFKECTGDVFPGTLVRDIGIFALVLEQGVTHDANELELALHDSNENGNYNETTHVKDIDLSFNEDDLDEKIRTLIEKIDKLSKCFPE